LSREKLNSLIFFDTYLIFDMVTYHKTIVKKKIREKLESVCSFSGLSFKKKFYRKEQQKLCHIIRKPGIQEIE